MFIHVSCVSSVCVHLFALNLGQGVGKSTYAPCGTLSLSIPSPQVKIGTECINTISKSLLVMHHVWVFSSYLPETLWKTKRNQHLFSWIETSHACSSLSLKTDKTYPWMYWSANKNWNEYSLSCLYVGRGVTEEEHSMFPSSQPLNKQYGKNKGAETLQQVLILSSYLSAFSNIPPFPHF